MSDERLREAERRWKESGSVDDEARYLLERVRVGDLTRERLELAAYCGHAGARSATSAAPPPSDCSAWAEGLGVFGRPVIVRAAVDAATKALAVWTSLLPNDDRPSAAIELARASLTRAVGRAFDAFDECIDAGADARALGHRQAEAAAEAAGWAALAADERTHSASAQEVLGLLLQATQVALGESNGTFWKQMEGLAAWALNGEMPARKA